MLSNTEIGNLALLTVGQGAQIEDLDSDTSAAGLAVKQAYPMARKIVLAEEDWHFARIVEALSPYSDVEEAYSDTWFYAYNLPSKCVRFIGIEPLTTLRPTWELRDDGREDAGGLILTNVAEAYGRFTFLQTNEARYSPEFCDALAKKIAFFIVPALVPGDYAKRLEVVHRQYLMALERAKIANINADRPSDVPASEAEKERS